ncbi:hypothetical protein D3C76_1378090 [compost metagenome]
MITFECELQLMEHCSNSFLVIRLQNIIKRLQLKGFRCMFLIRRRKYNVGFRCKLSNMMGQHHTVQRGNIDIEKNNIYFLFLQKLQYIQPIFKAIHHFNLTMFLD